MVKNYTLKTIHLLAMLIASKRINVRIMAFILDVTVR